MARPFKFYRIQREARILGFDDPVGAASILGGSLRDLQARHVHALGGELEDLPSIDAIPGEGLWFHDDLYFSEGLLRAALRASRDAREALRFCLRPNSFNERYALPDGEGFPADDSPLRPSIGFVPESGRERPARDAFLEQRVFRNPLAIPSGLVKAGEFSYDQCTVAAIRVLTPFHLLQANLAELFCATAPLREKLPGWFQRRFLRPYSRLFYFILRRQNRIGRNCLIHPTAVLEGVTLGDGVVVGANVVLRMCHVGAHTLIEDGSVIKYSVLGRRNYVCNGNQVVSCVTHDDVFLIHGPYQFSIFGRGSVAMAVLNCDVRLDRENIRIPLPGKGLIDSRQALLGIAYGHGAKVGAGNTIAPGRIVPNGLHLNPPTITTKFPETPTARYEGLSSTPS